jgi:lipopolysaccharide export system permease protein
MIIVVIASVIMLFDAAELFRILPKNISSWHVLWMSLLKNYNRIERSMPFMVMLSSMLTYSNLNRHAELIVLRSFGFSVWQFIAPAIVTAFIFGLLFLTVINPVGTFAYSRYELLHRAALNQNSPILFSQQGGIWLQQVDDKNLRRSIIHADSIVPKNNYLIKVLIFTMDENGNFIRRIDADKATYQSSKLLLPIAHITTPKLNKYVETNVEIDVTTSLDDITDNIIDLASISFLRLIPLIQSVKEAGFPVIKHQMQLAKMISMPFFFMAMVVVGICFSLRMERSSKLLGIQFFGALVGFIIYFTSDIFYALGAAGTSSIWFAASVPIGICTLTSVYYLLHNEDG